MPALEQLANANIREVELLYERVTPMLRYVLLVAKSGPSQYHLFCNDSLLVTEVFR